MQELHLMKFHLGPNSFTADDTFAVVVLISFSLAYTLIYWRALWLLLLRKDFESQDRILWFLVITMAPFVGLITFWFLVQGRAFVQAPPQAAEPTDLSKSS